MSSLCAVPNTQPVELRCHSSEIQAINQSIGWGCSSARAQGPGFVQFAPFKKNIFAQSKETVIGYVSFDDTGSYQSRCDYKPVPAIYINFIAVHRECQKYNYGRELFGRVVHYAQEQGIAVISLDCSEKTADRFFRKCAETFHLRFEKEVPKRGLHGRVTCYFFGSPRKLPPVLGEEVR